MKYHTDGVPMFEMVREFLRDHSGVTAIEYGLIAAMVAVAIIGGVSLLGGSVDGIYTDVSVTVDGASASFSAALPGGAAAP